MSKPIQLTNIMYFCFFSISHRKNPSCRKNNSKKSELPIEFTLKIAILNIVAGGFTRLEFRSSMNSTIEPIQVQSLKEACVARLEKMVLSGELKIGERLPSERDFASRLNVSRPVLHQALVDLEAKGLVQIIPRRGVFISDYRRDGSLAMLSSLLSYHNGQLAPDFGQSMLDMRMLWKSKPPAWQLKTGQKNNWGNFGKSWKMKIKLPFTIRKP